MNVIASQAIAPHAPGAARLAAVVAGPLGGGAGSFHNIGEFLVLVVLAGAGFGVARSPRPTPRTARRSTIGTDIVSLHSAHLDDEANEANPGNSDMAEDGPWLELEVGIGFLVGLGLGSLTAERTTTTIVLIALDIIVTPLMERAQIPYFIDGQRLLVGVPMDQLRPASLITGSVGGSPGGLVLAQRAPHGIPPMPTWATISVIVGWIADWSAIGAWRMMTRDA